jgi:hypothetical protein
MHAIIVIPVFLLFIQSDSQQRQGVEAAGAM